MSFQIVPFRITPEDLPDLDSKTRAGLQPLLDAINSTLQQVVASLATIQLPVPTSGTLVTDSSGEAVVTIKPSVPGKPWSVAVDQLRYTESTDNIAALWSWSWALVGPNVRAVFIGLPADTKFSFTMSMK